MHQSFTIEKNVSGVDAEEYGLGFWQVKKRFVKGYLTQKCLI